MEQFTIERRCEYHTSWYCECDFKAERRLEPIVEVVKPPKANGFWLGAGVAAVASTIWFGGFALIKYEESHALRLEKIEILKMQTEKGLLEIRAAQQQADKYRKEYEEMEKKLYYSLTPAKPNSGHKP